MKRQRADINMSVLRISQVSTASLPQILFESTAFSERSNWSCRLMPSIPFQPSVQAVAWRSDCHPGVWRPRWGRASTRVSTRASTYVAQVNGTQDNIRRSLRPIQAPGHWEGLSLPPCSPFLTAPALVNLSRRSLCFLPW